MIASKAWSLPAYKWWVVFMLWFVCFFNYADRQAISSVLPLLARDFGFNSVQLGWIGSAFAWVYAAGAPFAGIMADRFLRKRIIVAACVVWSGFTLATSWAEGFSGLVIVRALTGLGETFYFPAALALLSDYHGPRTRSRAFSWHQSSVYAGTILGSWLAALLAERLGWRFPFQVFGPVGVLLALVLAWLLREPARGAAEPETPSALATSALAATGEPSLSFADTFSLLLRTPAALLLMGGFLCANFVAVIFLTWTPTFLVEKFHYSLGAAGLTGTLYIHLASALSVPVAGWLADRLSRSWTGGRMLVQTIGLLTGAVFVFFVGKTGSTGTLVLAMACFGIAKGFYDSGIFASLYDVIEPRARGTAAGLMNTVGWSAGALGPLFVGLARQYGARATEMENMSDAIAFCALVYLIAAALVIVALFVSASRCGPAQAVLPVPSA